MAVTKGEFKGKGEERQKFQPDDQFGPSESGDALLLGMVGAETMNAPASKGLPGGGSKPRGAVPGSEQGPRRAGTSQPVPAGTNESGGVNSAFLPGADGQPVTKTNSGNGATQAKLSTPPYATKTGAGAGKKIIKTYGGNGGKATGPGGIK